MARLDWYIRANLKLRHLQLLVALDEMRNVGRVAVYLNVTQPAISKTLATLESGLGVQLFERTTRGIEPTEHGACLVRHARDILGHMVSARDEMLDLSEGRVTRISLGLLPAAAAVLVPQFIVNLESASTEVTVSVREATTDVLIRMLSAGDIDLAVGNLPYRPLGKEFQTERLYEDPIVVVARRDHPLASEPDLQWEMLSGYPMVLPPPETFTRAPIDDFMMQNRISISRRYVESVSTLTNIGVLQRTDSTGFLAREVARHFASMGLLSVLPLSLPNVQMDVGLVWVADRGRGKVHELVRQLFKETRDMMLPDLAKSQVSAPIQSEVGELPDLW